MDEARQRKRPTNQENQLLYFLVHHCLCWYQLGHQATTRGLVGVGDSYWTNHHFSTLTSSQTLERLELSQ
ncbi:Uncharacterised protein [Enterococcus malodoratus]|uniref:Uncharacterized protein n=1 Tax=Enterococcus malodoratus ATCC 43197 TaxID=1158601 RepID=R2NN49_9ENTE|nr:hypothetical protein UAI_03628 [Enterococcus malodoratus ATCC 43197]EOT67290.1 hypothetical protein I585_02811 [Enterococcus malodoratus ATCC 43197]SPX03253.1 Uncharacterised protein [Enterococcus malodoratus]STD69458.1 Uncharacterised protein [Enterococcus malodoratus]